MPANDPTTAVTTLAGNGVQGFFDGSGGRNGSAQFDAPTGVVVDRSGNVYVADYNNFRIRKVDPEGNTTTLAGDGTAALQDGTGGANGTAAFDHPSALTLDDAGGVLVVDAVDNRIRRVDASGNVTTLPCTGSGKLSFSNLFGIAVDYYGDIFVSDSNNNRICKIDPLGMLATAFAGGNMGNANGQGQAAQFSYPLGVAVDAAGNLYVADTQNNLIRRIDPAGSVTTLAGNGRAGFADGPGGTAEFSRPAGLTVDPLGNVIVAECGNRIRRIDPAGNVTTVAGNGDAGFADGTGEATGTAEFNCPDGVTVDSACNLYVGDEQNNRIRKITFGGPPP